MKIRSKGLAALALTAVAALGLTACSDADVASRDLSKAADYFEIDRRIVFYNGITNEYILEVEGRCSIGNEDEPGKLTVTCKTGEDSYKKHFLGLSDNVTYFAEQLQEAETDVYHYDVRFKPEALIPDVSLETSR